MSDNNEYCQAEEPRKYDLERSYKKQRKLADRNFAAMTDQDEQALADIGEVMRVRGRIRDLRDQIAILENEKYEADLRLLHFILKNDLRGCVSINYGRLSDICTR